MDDNGESCFRETAKPVRIRSRSGAGVHFVPRERKKTDKLPTVVCPIQIAGREPQKIDARPGAFAVGWDVWGDR